MKIALWIVQSLLAVMFLMAGSMKLSTPIPALVEQGMTWAGGVPPWMVSASAVAEIAGAVGLILPSVTRIRPSLTPLAAAGLALVMLFAVATHVVLGEAPQAAPALVLGLLCGFVAWGRSKKHPIASRS